MSIEEFADLTTTGFQGGGGEVVTPEEEFFHSIYVSASDRVNHINITEETGKLQIRGVQYNLDEINMIISHTKDILANIDREKKTGKETIKCFSYKDGLPPWVGTSKLANGSNRQCPQTSTDRAVNDFCNTCRAQILVAGIYCKPDGSPILSEEGKPIFLFIRARGMKYSNVSNYLNELYKEEGLSPLFQPVTAQSTEFEKSVVNNKRFVTNITKGQERTQYNSISNVFILNRGVQIANESVMSILKLSKNTMGKFNEKFDWSKNKKVMGYGQTTIPEGILPVDSGKKVEEVTTEVKTETPKTSEKIFSFDDINF